MKDYSVKVSVRNGRLLKRMKDCGFESQTDLARAARLPLASVNALFTMKITAYDRRGEWRLSALKLASALGCEPHDLFNEQQRQRALERNSHEVYMEEEQVRQIMAPDAERSLWAKIEIERVMKKLTAKERFVVEERLDGATLEEVGDEISLTRETVRQIEAKAFRKMKHAAHRIDGEYVNQAYDDIFSRVRNL